jgi:hypothetical protein
MDEVDRISATKTRALQDKIFFGLPFQGGKIRPGTKNDLQGRQSHKSQGLLDIPWYIENN